MKLVGFRHEQVSELLEIAQDVPGRHCKRIEAILKQGVVIDVQQEAEQNGKKPQIPDNVDG